MFSNFSSSCFTIGAFLAATVFPGMLPGETLALIDRGELRSESVVAPGLRQLDVGSKIGAERYSVPASAAGLRLRLFLEGKREGIAPLLAWNEIVVGGSFYSGQWAFYLLSEDGKDWIETEFSIVGEFPGWIDFDLVRGRGKENGFAAVFVDGSLIAECFGVNHSRSSGRFEVFSNEFATVSYQKVMKYDTVPEFAQRSLLRLRTERDRAKFAGEEPGWTREVRAALEETQSISYSTRRNLHRASRFIRPARAGDLSFEEQAWHLTRTVNRTYFAFDPSFRAESAIRDGDRLRMLGADYLPVLESRDWEAPHAYENWDDFYIEKLSGYLVPEVDGMYEMFISGDESAALYLSVSGDPTELELAASFLRPTAHYEWDRFPSQSTGAISLSSHQPVYFEIWHVEKLGSDHLSVAWIPPNGTRELIPSKVLSSSAQGEPGTFPRPGLVLKDPSKLGEAPLIASESPVVELGLQDGKILEGEFIEQWFFNDQLWRAFYKPTNEGGLGTVALNAITDWPAMWSYQKGQWINYTERTANPQRFFLYSSGLSLLYYPDNETQFETVSLPIKYDFESQSDLTDWTSLQYNANQWWKWISPSSSYGTSSGGTGAITDHTLRNSNGHYIYLETSSGYAFVAGDTGRFEGPWIQVPASGAQMVFYYHMYGSQIGTLKVSVKSTLNGAQFEESVPVSVSGQTHTSYGGPFLRADADLSAFSGTLVQVCFEGVAVGGYMGDIVVDDISIFASGADTDGDGVLDGFEMINGSDPGSAESWTGDDDPDGDLFSHASEMIVPETGIDVPSASLPANQALNAAMSAGDFRLMVVLPDQPARAIGQDLTMSELTY